MLEHVADIGLVARNLMSITADGGYILISVPYRYRIHHDPIDNGFRPTPGEILALFPSAQITCVAKAIISITDPFYYGIKNPGFPSGATMKGLTFFLGKGTRCQACCSG